MKSNHAKLTDLNDAWRQKHVKRYGPLCSGADEHRAEFLQELSQGGITTLGELLQELPSLSLEQQHMGCHWLSVVKPPGTVAVLLTMLPNADIRWRCAHALGMLKSPRKDREFTRIGREQLASGTPDVRWLEAVVFGLGHSRDANAVEVVVSIYEREDLPGWLRGDAGDKLGCAGKVHDRRTRLFRRTLAAALKGLHDPAIEMQFYSMYVLMQLAIDYSKPVGKRNDIFKPALPRLRKIARDDHRLAPGLWWPMCEEAKDAIHAIQTGHGIEVDAGERCMGNDERGEVCQRY